MNEIDKELLLKHLNERLEAKSNQIDRLVAEGSDDGEAICEWGVYRRVIDDIEKGKFDLKDIKPKESEGK